MPKSKHLSILSIGLIIFLLLVLALALKDNTTTISAKEFEIKLQQQQITKLWESDDYLYAQSTDKHTYKLLRSLVDSTLIQSTPIEQKHSKWLIYAILGTLFLLVIAISLILYRKTRLSITPINANLATPLESTSHITPLDSNVRFSDVAGIAEVKAELLEIVDFLRYPQKYQRFNINLPKGVLLSGVPGVGKTLLAKALAGESGVPFFYQSGASFVEMYVGVGAKRVRELFNAAKTNAPCIVFIDEIDAIGKRRKDGGSSERESTLNQLLVEMDGFSDNSGVIVLAATNHIESLDPALLRSGRFDRKLFIELPNTKEREQILAMYLAKKPHNLHDEIPHIAQKTAGFSGASLATLVNEAALNALRHNATTITKSDFDELYSKIHNGLKRLPLLDPYMRDVYAIYHASKLLYAIYHNLPLHKLTLFESTLTPHTPHTLSHSELLLRLRFHLIGDRALRVVFGDSFGIFSTDKNEAQLCIKQGLELGLLNRQEARNLQASIVYNATDIDLEEFVSFIRREWERICSLACILVEEERLDSGALATLDSSMVLESNSLLDSNLAQDSSSTHGHNNHNHAHIIDSLIRLYSDTASDKRARVATLQRFRAYLTPLS